MNRIEPKRFVQICWIGLATAALAGIFIVFFAPQIQNNAWLTLLVIGGFLPGGVVQLTLIWQLIERYRWRSLLILVLVPWPVTLYLTALLVPVGFLAFLTHRVYARAAVSS